MSRRVSAAIVNVDCDLYESALPVLDFVVPFLKNGTVLYLDDWFAVPSIKEGVARAFREFEKRTHNIEFHPYREVGVFGKTFAVTRSD